MDCTAVFSSLQRRKSPLVRAYFGRVNLSNQVLIQTLAAVAGNLVSSSSSSPSIPFQRRNFRSLVRKVKIFFSLFEFLMDSPPLMPNPLPSSVTLCFKELYILVYKSKVLLDYCSQSSRLWLLLHNSQISGHFHDLNLEMSTLLDVFPLSDLNLIPDVREQIELLQRQARRTKLYIDAQHDMLRLKIFAFLADFDKGRVPDPVDLQTTFVNGIGIQDARTCAAEIEFLEEQIHNQEEEVDISVLKGVIALTRYCKVVLFGFDWGGEDPHYSGICKKSKGRMVGKGIGETSLMIPKDFCCPISMDLMHDPVIVSTGQTYDRSSILQWVLEGHSTCPSSGQMLTLTFVPIPNRALQSLISHWCEAQGLPYDHPKTYEASTKIAKSSASKAAIEANRATVELLVSQLKNGPENAKSVAAHELRLMVKTERENRVWIAEAGVIPLLHQLLSSSNPVAQQNAVSAILNLSTHYQNKTLIMEEKGCLRSIVEVLRHGSMSEARESAAATLLYLSIVNNYKEKIICEEGALEALVRLVREGTPRGKRDSAKALYSLSTHFDYYYKRIMNSGMVSALVGALESEVVAEFAAKTLAMLVRNPVLAVEVGRQDKAIDVLVGLMREGGPRAKENAVAALLDMCQYGGAVLEVARAPELGVLIESLQLTGTRRARRKAVLLMRFCQWCEPTFWGGVLDHTLTESRSMRSGASFGAGDVPVSAMMPVAISVPVL